MKRIILGLSVVVLAVACGPAESSEAPANEASQETMETPVEETAPAEAPAAMSFTVKTTGETMTDMAFAPKQLVVNAGAEVTITLTNEAESAAMVHNLVIINVGSQEEINTQAMEAGVDAEFVPENDNIIAATSLANPGEEVTVTFTAPAAGTYQYICTYPGHASMKGILVVN